MLALMGGMGAMRRTVEDVLGPHALLVLAAVVGAAVLFTLTSGSRRR